MKWGGWLDAMALKDFFSGESIRPYRLLGSHPLELGGEEGYRFAVWAPHAADVSLVGDFNDWNPDTHPMEAIDGVWQRFIPGLGENACYKYAIRTPDGELLHRGDPYANYWEVRPGTASRTTDLRNFQWRDGAWMANRKGEGPINIYEVHLGSWRRNPEGGFLTYRQLAEQLSAYAKEMGYTHIELLPVMEHPLDASWGYQVTGYYAPTSRYGSPKDFMGFVDACHQANLGVILDWVPAHFARDAQGLRCFDGQPLYEHPDPRRGEVPQWGTCAFDYGRPEVAAFLTGNLIYWAELYHVDGFRADAVTAMLYLDFGREADNWLPNALGGRENLEGAALIRRMNQVVHREFPGVMMIAEESTAWLGVSGDAGLGFQYKWNMGWMNDILAYMSLPSEQRVFEHRRLTFSMMYAFTERFVLPLSHDEVVHGKHSLIGRMPGEYDEKFAQLKALYGFMVAHPGKKLLFMGGEFGQFIEWNEEQGLDWLLLSYPRHRQLQRFVKKLNHYYLGQPALWQREADWSGFEWLVAEDSESRVAAFLRRDDGGRELMVTVNFSPEKRDRYRIGLPGPGKLVEVLNSDLAEFGGRDICNHGVLSARPLPAQGRDWSVELTIPPYGVLYFTYDRQEKECAE